MKSLNGENIRMKHSYCAASGAVELRPLVEAETENLRQLRNRSRHMFIFSGEITPEGQQAWYVQYLGAPGDYMFSVYYQNRWIGAVSIYEVKDGCAEFGRLLIDRDAAGRGGLGVDATRAACKIAFEQLGVERIALEVYCDNPAAQITYLKAGFRPISIFSNNGKRPMIHMHLSKRGSAV